MKKPAIILSAISASVLMALGTALPANAADFTRTALIPACGTVHSWQGAYGVQSAGLSFASTFHAANSCPAQVSVSIDDSYNQASFANIVRTTAPWEASRSRHNYGSDIVNRNW